MYSLVLSYRMLFIIAGVVSISLNIFISFGKHSVNQVIYKTISIRKGLKRKKLNLYSFYPCSNSYAIHGCIIRLVNNGYARNKNHTR